MQKPDPVAVANDAARAEARQILADAGFAALAFLDAVTATPAISRIAFGLDPAHRPLSLISSLSSHHAALTANPSCALMVGEPGPKGDPLTHPRLMLQARAVFGTRTDADHPALRDQWLLRHPKSRLYVDFADFGFVRFAVTSAMLNGGLGLSAFASRPDVTPASAERTADAALSAFVLRSDCPCATRP
jgi:heme iron utilization protein